MLRRHKRLSFSGSIHFVTSVTATRGDWFFRPEVCERILAILEDCRSREGVLCLGYVLMPDHLHALLVQQDNAIAIPVMMREFKRRTAYVAKTALGNTGTLWRRRYDDVPVPNREAAVTRLKYMHENPVRRGLVQAPEEYLWSSARDWADLAAGRLQLARELV